MKRLFAVCLALALTLGAAAFPAFADGAEADALRCPCCGEEKLVQQPEQYSDWVTVEFVPCEHGDPRHNDDLQQREVFFSAVCSQCGACVHGQPETESGQRAESDTVCARCGEAWGSVLLESQLRHIS